MAFTGVAVVTKIAEELARITGVSLAAGASGTIGLFGSGADVELPEGCHWGPYDGIDLAEAVQVAIAPGIALTVAKAAAPFLVTLTNDAASALGDQVILGKMTANGLNQEVGDAAIVIMDFNAETYDIGGCVDIVNNRFTAPVAGKYLVTSIVEWVGTVIADGIMTDQVTVDAALVVTATQSINVSGGSAFARSNVVSTVLDLAAGQLVTFSVSQISGAPQNIFKGEATFSLLAGTAPAATPGLEIYCRFH